MLTRDSEDGAHGQKKARGLTLARVLLCPYAQLNNLEDAGE